MSKLNIVACLAAAVGLLAASVPAVRSKRVNMIIYGSELDDGPRLVYTDNHPSRWNEILATIETQHLDWVRCCSVGTWLMYRSEGLVVSNLTDVTLVTSDTRTCVRMTDFEAGILSAQPLSMDGKLDADMLVAFEQPNFAGVGRPVPQSGRIQSLATVGKKTWSVMLREPERDTVTRFCLVPPQEHSGTPVCLMSHFADGVHLKGIIAELKLDNCADIAEENKFALKVCHDLNQGKVRPIEQSSPTVSESGEATSSEKPGGGEAVAPAPGTCLTGDSTGILSEEQVALIMQRLDGSLSSGDPRQSPDSRLQLPNKLVWIEELFYKCLQVFQEICSTGDGSLLDPEFLNLFAGLYWHHYAKGLEKDDGAALASMAGKIAEEDWREMLHDMDMCLSVADDEEYNLIGTTTLAAFRNYHKLEDLAKKVNDWVPLGEGLDYVMEINYLMANLVGRICHRANNYDANFLTRFVDMYHVFFLAPVQAQWKEPGNMTRVYEYLFGGYGMRKSLLKLGYCTGNALSYTAIQGNYPRPFDHNSTILFPSIN